MTAITSATGSMPDASDFATAAERITNNALVQEWLTLYHPDAIAEWIADGAYERYEGLTAILPAATALANIWREHHIYMRKSVECASADTIVLSWRGGFGGKDRQVGTEIWKFRDGLVIRHQMYAYLDVRPSTSWLARARLFAASPRIAIALLRNQERMGALSR